MRIRKGPVALVVLALATEMAYVLIKGNREVAAETDRRSSADERSQNGGDKNEQRK